MSWNEPGKSKSGGNDTQKDPHPPKNPWESSNNRRKDGPPDLDELWKKISKIFGDGGSKSGGSSSSDMSPRVIVFGLMIVVALWLASGFYTVGEAERGVVLRLGKYDHIVDPGLNWRPRFIDDVTTVNVQTIRTLLASGSMLTKDENVMNIDMGVQYRIADPYKYLYRVTNADDSLRQATDSALRAVIGDAIMDNILTSGRQQIRQNTHETLNRIIDKYDMGIMVIDVTFQSARPPEQVKDSFDDAIAAREDEERYIREAEAYTNEILPKAMGRASRLKKEALGYVERTINEAEGQIVQFDLLLPEYRKAPEVTRNRLYIDTLTRVYEKTTKILVDTKSGNNMLYLPLDRLTSKSNNQNMVKENVDVTPYETFKLDPANPITQKDASINSTTTRQGRY